MLISFLLIFSVSLSVFEYLRGILFTGFSWNLISYSWSFSLESIQILKFFGTYTFNFFSKLRYDDLTKETAILRNYFFS